MTYYVYVLKSVDHAKSYTGITDNITRRLGQHNNGYHFYTRRYCPWVLVYKESYTDRQSARNREKYLKSAVGRHWLRNNVFSNLS